MFSDDKYLYQKGSVKAFIVFHRRVSSKYNIYTLKSVSDSSPASEGISQLREENYSSFATVYIKNFNDLVNE